MITSRRHVQVGDAPVGVDHGQRGPGLVGGRDGLLDRLALVGGQLLERGEHAGQPVVRVGADAPRGRRRTGRTRRGSRRRTARPNRIGSDTFIIVALRCTENSTPRSLASATCSARNASSAARRITAASTISPASTGSDSLSTVTVPSAATCSMRRVVGLGGGERGLGVAEVAVGPWSTTCEADSGDHAPIECGWLRAKLLHAGRGAAVGVALAQHRVDRAALDRVVRRPRGLLVVGLRVLRVVGDGVARGLQLGDRRLELRDRRADVRQLDDVGLGGGGQRAELGQRVGHQVERGADAAGQRDVARLDRDPGRARERLDHGQERVRRQRRCLVGVGVDDLHRAAFSPRGPAREDTLSPTPDACGATIVASQRSGE